MPGTISGDDVLAGVSASLVEVGFTPDEATEIAIAIIHAAGDAMSAAVTTLVIGVSDLGIDPNAATHLGLQLLQARLQVYITDLGDALVERGASSVAIPFGAEDHG